MPKQTDKHLRSSKASPASNTARGQRHQYKNISPRKFNLYVNLLYDIYVEMWKNGKQLATLHNNMNPANFTEFKKQLSSAIGEGKLGTTGPIGLYWHTENTADSNPLFSLYEMHNSNHLFDYLYVLILLSLEKIDTSDYLERAIKPACDSCGLREVCKYIRKIPSKKDVCLFDDILPDPRDLSHPYFSMDFIFDYLYLFFANDLTHLPDSIEKDIGVIKQRHLHIDNKTKKSRLDYLCKCGYLEKSQEVTKKAFYRLRRNNLLALVRKVSTIDSNVSSPTEDSEEYNFFAYRFLSMLDFFSETFPLGEVGYRLAQNLCVKDYESKKAFRYKHRFILNALNDFKLIDILFAIQNGSFLEVTFTDKSKFSPLMPLQIRISGTDGREKLVYFHPEQHEIQSFCLDSVYDITLLSEKESPVLNSNTEQELRKARTILEDSWGLDFDDIEGGNCFKKAPYPVKVHAELSFPANSPQQFKTKGDPIEYLKEKLLRESDGLPYRLNKFGDKDTVVFNCSVSSFEEFKNWLGQYIQFVKSIGKTAVNTITEPDPHDLPFASYLTERNSIEGLRPSTDLLYNEISNSVFSFVWSCFEYRELDGTDTLNEEISVFSNNQENEKYVEPVISLYHLLRSFFPSNSYIHLPLNKLEVNYLFDIARSPFAALFLEPSEVKAFQETTGALLSSYSETTWYTEDYQLPIFDLNRDIVFCHLQKDKAIDPKLASNVRKILASIYSQKICHIHYLNNKSAIDSNSGDVLFDSLFYSNRENTIRAYAYRFSEDQERNFGRTLRVDKIEFDDTYKSTIGCLSKKQIRECKNVVNDMIFRQSASPVSLSEVKVGLIGMKPSEMERFLHEISYYTVENVKRREYSNSESIAKLVKLCAIDLDRTSELASFEILRENNSSHPETCKPDPDTPIDFESSRGRNPQRVIFKFKNSNDSSSASETRTVSAYAEDIFHVVLSNALRFYLPCVVPLEYENLFEYVVTIKYPENDFSEIADILHKYKDIFVLIDEKSIDYLTDDGRIKRVFQGTKDITNGIINRTHSVPLKILLAHESLDLGHPVCDSFAEEDFSFT